MPMRNARRWCRRGGLISFRRRYRDGPTRLPRLYQGDHQPVWPRRAPRRNSSSARSAAVRSSVEDGNMPSMETTGSRLSNSVVMCLPEIQYESHTTCQTCHQEEDGETPQISLPYVVPSCPKPTTCTSCAICIEDFAPGERLRLLPRCRHAFHTECIVPWLTERSDQCPMCKKMVVVEQEYDEDARWVENIGITVPAPGFSALVATR